MKTILVHGILIGLLTSSIVILMLSCESKNSQQKMRAGFSFQIEPAPETGWDVITLEYKDPLNPRATKRVKIVPQAGNNLYSFFVAEKELLVQPPAIKDLPGVKYGVPILYPTPNRVRDGILKFNDLELKFEPNKGNNFIHGLVNNVAWQYEPPELIDIGLKLKTWLDFAEGTELYQQFPFKHRLNLEFILSVDGITFKFKVENQDEQPLPFGFGLHPFFNILGPRDSIMIRIPALSRMEAVDLLPTGKLLPIDQDPAADLREYRPLADLKLDDVYWGMTPIKPAAVRYLSHDLQLTFRTSSDFTHAVLYTPQNKDFFCLENQTCSTDAHNLYTKGFKEESHLMIVAPGQFIEGFVKYQVTGIMETP